MLEFLTNYLLWWHWIAFGIFLITFEIFTGTFILLGLGLSAMIVGVSDNLFKTSLELELTLWIVLSILSLMIWFKYLKDQSQENSGQSNYALDTEGVVIQSIEANGRGEVKFDHPLLGNITWHVTSKEDISLSSRIKIVQIKGQLIEVASL
jgi:membrane protein implicated in regulation of membrane protease activity